MFAAHHPSTSPASFETSYLQQQMNLGRTSLQGPHRPSTDHHHSALSTSPSNHSIEEGERGRRLSNNGKKSSRTSVSSAYSHERRLSPTRESINESEDNGSATEGESERISILPVHTSFLLSLSLLALLANFQLFTVELHTFLSIPPSLGFFKFKRDRSIRTNSPLERRRSIYIFNHHHSSR